MSNLYCVDAKHKRIIASMQIKSEQEEALISRVILLLEYAGFIDGKYRDCIIASSKEDLFDILSED